MHLDRRIFRIPEVRHPLKSSDSAPSGHLRWAAAFLHSGRTSVALAVALLLHVPAQHTLGAQQQTACSDPAARAFDFWIGEWDIQQHFLQRDGTFLELPATTSVERALDGCAILERWRGRVQFFWEEMDAPQEIQGLSVRAYDPRSDTWSIHWMDTRSPVFGEPYSGRFVDGRGEFLRSSPDRTRTTRITFTRPGDGLVHWELAFSADSGRTWQRLWTMDMRRR